MNSVRKLLIGAALVLSTGVGSAFAQVDESAKAIIQESAKAIKQSNGLVFKTRRSATGMLKDLIDADASVKILRNAQMKNPLYMIEGRIKQPTKADRKINVMSDGILTQWLDWEKNLLNEYPAGEKDALSQTRLASQMLIPPAFVDAEPFEKELKLPNISRAANKRVHDEECEVIEFKANANSSITVAVSAIDRLPREIVETSGSGDKSMSRIFEVFEVKPTPMNPKEFEIALPPNFKKEIKKAAPPPAQPSMGDPVPVEHPQLGLETGAAVPSFSLTDAAGQTLTGESLKGKVTVLHFFGSSFKQSTVGLEDLQAISEKYKGKANVVGLACREADNKAAATLFQSRQINYTLVPKAEGVMGDFKVVGFPSYYIINADGKVAAFFQGFASRNELSDAIDAAMKK